MNQRSHLEKAIPLLIAFALCIALFGCGSPAGDSKPVQTEVELPAPEVTEPSASDEIVAEEEAAPGYFLLAEYNRLYYVPQNGSAPELVIDNSTVCTVRHGNWLYASFEDGSVSRVSLSGREVTELVPAGGHVYRKLIPFEGGFIGVYFSFYEGDGYDLYREGSQSLETLFQEKLAYTPSSAGRFLYRYFYDSDNGNRLSALDLNTLEKVWDYPLENAPDFVQDGEEILCFVPNSGRSYRIDEAAQTLVPLDIPLAKTDCDMFVCDGGNCLVGGNYSDEYRKYLINQNGRQELSALPEYFSVMDVQNGKVLLHSVKGAESNAGENIWYTIDSYTLLDLETGECRDFPFQGSYGKLFAGGDFPVLDSSTARKPVTSEIYAFFCESTDAGGTVPLCSTTHGAWLNIADGVADLALLAAPTKEEQEYLDDRGVQVEMKLYGGDGLVFIGNRACGVENLTLDQVRAIYRGEITNWAQLGGTDHAIRVLYRDDQSGSQRLFERMLWKEQTVPDFNQLGFEILGDMSTIVSECLHDPYAIGYSIMTYLNDVYGNEQLLAFSLEGYEANPENVASQKYPLGTQGYVVIRSDEPEDSPARRLFNWFGSPLSDVFLTRNGVTPLHENG